MPNGFTGLSSVLPKDQQESPDFVPIEDRWHIGFLPWDRYGKGHPPVDDYPYEPGSIWDPYGQNLLKGDYPIMGQNTFLNLTAESLTVMNAREVPTQTTPFESTSRPHQTDFFGLPGQFFYSQDFSFTMDLFHGDAAFKPVDWRILITPVFNINSLNLNELAQVNPNVTKGTGRERTFFALQEWFVKHKLADLSPDYDFVSVRVGSQPFTSDFRGFLFSDVNTAVRLFGTYESNRDQFNLIAFDQQEKDTNSQLNMIGTGAPASLHCQLFPPGFYMAWLYDGSQRPPTTTMNRVFTSIRTMYWCGPTPSASSHRTGSTRSISAWAATAISIALTSRTSFIGRLAATVSTKSPTNRKKSRGVCRRRAFLRPRLGRFRTSFLYASGDGNANNKHATGFDSILDDQQFAGGEFSYWQRQAIPLKASCSKTPAVCCPTCASKIEGQSNFVNPGLLLYNFGIDMDLTPKWKSITNCNFLSFDKTNSLETFTFQGRIHRFIGTDISTGIEYRPLLSNNIIVKFGVSTLVPGQGFSDLYNPFHGHQDSLFASFAELTLAY